MKKGLVLFLVLGLAGLGVSKSLVYGANYYVDSLNGSDTNSGISWETAFKTINTATSKAVAGDTVYVNQGTYKETVTFANSGTADAPIVLKAIGEAKIDGEWIREGFIITSRDYLILEGFTITRGIIRGMYLCNCSHLTVQNFIFISNGNQYISGSGGAIAIEVGWDVAVSSIIIRHCDFTYNYPGAIAVGVHYGCRLNNLVIVNCNFIGNQGNWTISCTAYWEEKLKQLTIKNCNFVNNRVSVGVVHIFARALSAVKECDYNNFYNNSWGVGDYWWEQGFFPLGEHDLHLDPQFVPGTSWYLKPTSPLLKAGSFENGEFQNIGAHGVGIVSSWGIDNWTGWIDEQGNLVSVSSLVEFDANKNIKLKSGVTKATIRSPVIDSQQDTAKVKAITFDAFEETELPVGMRQVIDFDETTVTREIRWRGSNSSFNVTDSIPDWQIAYKNTKIEPAENTRYLQIELTLRLNVQQ